MNLSSFEMHGEIVGCSREQNMEGLYGSILFFTVSIFQFLHGGLGCARTAHPEGHPRATYFSGCVFLEEFEGIFRVNGRCF